MFSSLFAQSLCWNYYILINFELYIQEEAENERMHLMTALELKQPGILFRGIILLGQGEDAWK